MFLGLLMIVHNTWLANLELFNLTIGLVVNKLLLLNGHFVSEGKYLIISMILILNLKCWLLKLRPFFLVSREITQLENWKLKNCAQDHSD